MIEQSYKLGQVAPDGELEHLQGKSCCLRDRAYDLSNDPIEKLNSQMDVHATWVKNQSGVVLPAGAMVTWDAAGLGPGLAIGGIGAVNSLATAGVVDSYISASVPDDSWFWLITKGPCRFLFTTGTTIAVGESLAMGATGYVIKMTVGTTAEHLRVGRTLAGVNTAVASGTLFRGYVDIRF